MTTTRRTDRTRKPPRRPPVRMAARADDPAKTSETTALETPPAEIATAPLMSESPAAEPLHVSENVAADPLLAGTSTVAMLAAEAPVAAPLVADAPEALAEADGAEQTGDAPTSESGPSPEVSAAQTTEAPVSEAPAEAPVAETAEPGIEAPSFADSPVEAHGFQEPTASDPVAVETTDEATNAESEPAPGQAPDGRAPVSSEPVSSAAEPAAAPGPSGEEDVPLAAMQGFIEINGRLVAFFQGESQAALAFWKAALAARSPSDLAQLQAAEMSRAVDAALACWTDLARRMGRFQAFTAPLARAA